MPKLLASLTCLVFFAPAFVSACSSDSDDPPPASAGTAGAAGSPQGGSAGHAGNSGQAGKATSAGSSAGGSAGSSSAGSNAGGSGGTGGMVEPEAGAPGSGAGAGGETGGDEVVSECLDAPVLDEVRTEALHFMGQGLELGIVRRADPDSVGTSGTTPWLPERFALDRGTVSECVSTLANLDYVGSHHNFDDQMTATVGTDTWTFKQMREDYDMPTTWTVEASSGNALLWGPITLTLVSCTRLDTPGSCADQYQ